ncbi:hypothetical protein MTP03_25540 [Tsukamurella sp. PLM1]|nr:flavodoxin domain-containing protein [Tsukamurella sp. PLM1]BDH57615.1 hypothetical protein MTP03_25540 [Tsukamurella sp. PLM1]
MRHVRRGRAACRLHRVLRGPARGRARSHRPRFAVFGLGDTIYVDTYNAAGKTIVEHLTGLGATQVGDRFEHDNSGTDDVDEKAVEWAEEIVGQI